MLFWQLYNIWFNFCTSSYLCKPMNCFLMYEEKFTACLMFGPVSWFVFPKVLNSQVYLNCFHAEKSENKILSLFPAHIPLRNVKLRVLDLEYSSKYMLCFLKITEGKSLHRYHVVECNEEAGNKRLQVLVWCFAKMKNNFGFILREKCFWKGALFLKAEDRSSM